MRASIFSVTGDLGVIEFTVNPGVVRVSDDSIAALKAARPEPIPMRVFGAGHATLTIQKILSALAQAAPKVP